VIKLSEPSSVIDIKERNSYLHCSIIQESLLHKMGLSIWCGANSFHHGILVLSFHIRPSPGFDARFQLLLLNLHDGPREALRINLAESLTFEQLHLFSKVFLEDQRVFSP